MAIFDVEGQPEEDAEFGDMVEGYFTPLKRAIPRAELLANPALEPVFRHIQGRRRLLPAAQEAMVELIANAGQTPLPPHSLT